MRMQDLKSVLKGLQKRADKTEFIINSVLNDLDTVMLFMEDDHVELLLAAMAKLEKLV
jgi:hypothetical protein